MEQNSQVLEALGHVQSPRFVDPTFLERLHRFDPALEPRWNPLKCKWEIWRQSPSGAKYILTVQYRNVNTEETRFRPLDNRVIWQLYNCDTRRYANQQQYIWGLHIEDERFQKQKVHEQDEYVRACHRDMLPFVRGAKTVAADPDKIRKQEEKLDAS